MRLNEISSVDVQSLNGMRLSVKSCNCLYAFVTAASTYIGRQALETIALPHAYQISVGRHIQAGIWRNYRVCESSDILEHEILERKGLW